MSYVVSITDPEAILSRELLQQLEVAAPEWLAELRLLGKKPEMDIYYKGEPMVVHAPSADSRSGVDIAIFGSSDDLSAGAVIIGLADDHADALIVHPDLNPDAVQDHRGVLQVPDATGSTIAIIADALDTPIRDITGTLVLPASTLGPAAIEELYSQTIALFNQQPIPTNIIGERLAFNLLPGQAHMTCIDSLLTAPMSLTTITAPLFGGTTLILDFWMDGSVEESTVIERLTNHPSIIVTDSVQPALIVDTEKIALVPPEVANNRVRIVACIDEVRRNATAVLSLVQSVCESDAF